MYIWPFNLFLVLDFCIPFVQCLFSTFYRYVLPYSHKNLNFFVFHLFWYNQANIIVDVILFIFAIEKTVEENGMVVHSHLE